LREALRLHQRYRSIPVGLSTHERNQLGNSAAPRPRRMMRRLSCCLPVASVPAFAQEQEPSASSSSASSNPTAFSLRLRHPRASPGAPGDLRRQQELDTRQTTERQRLDNAKHEAAVAM